LHTGTSGGPLVRGSSPAGLLGVAFLGRNLVVGGAERVFLHYVGSAYAVRPVVVLRRREGGLLADLAPDIPVYDLKYRDPVREARYGPHDDAITVPDPPTGFTLRSLIELVQESRRLRRVVRSTGCTVVSSFLMRAHIIALLTKRFLLPDLCVVVNVHNHTSESEPHLYPTRTDRFLLRWVVRHLFPVADRIVVVAESLAEDLVLSFGIDRQSITVVHNPIHLAGIRDAAQADAPELAAIEGRPLIVAVGRLARVKGFDLLVEAMKGFSDADPTQLVIVGDGPERAELTALAERLGVAHRVHFLGMQSNPWKFMSRATLLALPSRTEAFPNVIGEALALGVPVVAADCTAGIREYLDDGRCGVLVEPNDVEALERGLARLLDDSTLREDLGIRGRKRMERLDLPHVVRRYEDTLRSAAGLAPLTGARPAPPPSSSPAE